MRWKKVMLVGVGLLGGSLGLALRERRLAGSVVGLVRRPISIRECEAMGVVERATMDVQEAATGVDLVILCTPIAQMASKLKQILPTLPRGAVITDVGSVKASVVRQLERLCSQSGCHFVGSHPMAGGEKIGVSAARPGLFANAVCVVTTTRNSHRPSVQKISALWKAVGCRVITLRPEVHDRLVSRSSHLPHVLAGALVKSVLRNDSPPEQALLCATGFRDSTRIASGSPEMWRDIALANGKNLNHAVSGIIKELQTIQKHIANADARKIEQFFMIAKQLRDQWQNGCSRGQKARETTGASAGSGVGQE